MLKSFPNIRLLLKRLALILFIYFLLRLIFLLTNFNYFSPTGFKNILISFLAGLRFDISAIAFTNCLFILLHLIPFKFFYTKKYQTLLKIIFFLTNIPAIILNLVDIIYFKFTLKRATKDAFDLAGIGDDFKNSITGFITSYWYVFIIMSLMIILMFKLYNKIKVNPENSTNNNLSPKSKVIYNTSAFIFFVLITILGARGGFQLRPLNILHAAEYASTENAPLILNTSFTLIKSFDKKSLTPIKYFDDKTEKSLFNPIHIYNSNQDFQKMNIVIIIMESFSKEYIGALNNYEGYTPFLDSLISKSLVFTNAFANGKKSIEGIPAVIAGIPVLMDEPFITSPYSGNKITGIAEILKSEGYKTSFFHGGSNGTMGFESFTKSVGFENYYGRNEYNNEKDFDGKWGIFDEPFFQYFANNLNKMNTPFLSCIFSLSSHHPYTIPDQYKNKFKKGTLPIHQSIRYSDYSLKRFFETASTMPWFNNTLFIITADHAFDSEYSTYQTPVGKYRIPIIFYKPDSDLKGKSETVIQQIDIIPSILDYIHYSKPIFSFGSSTFDSTASHSAFNYLGGVYQIISKDYSLQYNENRTLAINNYSKDSLMQINLKGKETIVKDSLERKIKAIIQEYNYDMLNNKFRLENK